jgi:hypothetical protein
MLESVGVAAQEASVRALVRLNTREHFTQTKFNLFAEVSEVRRGRWVRADMTSRLPAPQGYAKLVTELHGAQLPPAGDAAAAAAASAALLRSVRAFIGYFSLDPNRVFGQLLEAYEVRASVAAAAGGAAGIAGVDALFLPLLSPALYSRAKLTQLLGFQLAQHVTPAAAASSAASEPTLRVTRAAVELCDELVPPHPPPSVLGGQRARPRRDPPPLD